MNSSLISRVVIAVLLFLSVQSAWGDSASEEGVVLKEYDRLLNLANDGTAEDKLALFSYTAAHTDELGNYSETALTHLAEASTDGNGQASFWIGHMAENGIWIDQNDQGALIYYVLSAQQGYDKGMYRSVRLFSSSVRDATSDQDREAALLNAQKWYDALAAIQDTSEELFRSARFSYAVARLSSDAMDENGLTLMSEAALDGHENAISLIRKLFADASSDFEKDEDAVRFVERFQPIIDVIGTAD